MDWAVAEFDTLKEVAEHVKDGLNENRMMHGKDGLHWGDSIRELCDVYCDNIAYQGRQLTEAEMRQVVELCRRAWILKYLK